MSDVSSQTTTVLVSLLTRRSASLQTAHPLCPRPPLLTHPTPQTQPWVSWRPSRHRWPRAPSRPLTSTKNPPTLHMPPHILPKSASGTAAPKTAATRTRTHVRPARPRLKNTLPPLPPRSLCCFMEELRKESR